MKKVAKILIVSLICFLSMTATLSAAMADTNLPMASGLTVQTEEIEAKDDALQEVKENTTYRGTITGAFSVNDLLSEANRRYQGLGFLKSMVSGVTMFSREGAKPHVTYTLSLPQDKDVTFDDEGTSEENSEIISAIHRSLSADRKQLTYTIDLAWLSYGQFFAKYENDIPNNPMMNVSVSYTGTAAQGDSYEPQITGSGGGILWHRRVGDFIALNGDNFAHKLYTAKYTPARKFNVHYQFVSEDTTLTLPNELLQRLADKTRTDVAEGIEVSVTDEPIVNTETLETPEGKWIFVNWDKLNATIVGDDVTFTGTWRFEPKPETINENVLLDGDLRNAYHTPAESPMEFTDSQSSTQFGAGIVYSQAMMAKLEELKNRFEQEGLNIEQIQLSEVSSKLDLAFTLPHTMTFVENSNTSKIFSQNQETYTLENINASTDRVTADLVFAQSATTFKELYDIFAKKSHGILNFVFGDSEYTSNSQVNTVHKALLEVAGNLTFKANTGTKVIDVNYNLKAVQNPKVADPGSENDPAMTFATIYKKQDSTPVSPIAIQEDIELKGDLRINDETQNQRVLIVNKEAELNFSGDLYVTSIKEKLATIRNMFATQGVQESNYPNILLNNTEFTMISEFALPSEMEFSPAQVNATLVDDSFEIKDVQINGKTVIVKAGLKNIPQNFAELNTAVENANDKLTVTLSAAKFTSSAVANTNYTALGKVVGYFSSEASLANQQVNFRFNFITKQHEDGADSTNPTSKNISFTLRYEEQPTPTLTPDVSKTSDNPPVVMLPIADIPAISKENKPTTESIKRVVPNTATK